MGLAMHFLIHLALAAILWIVAPALAAGTATPGPPPPPEVDMGGLPESAVFRPTNRDDSPHQVELRLFTDKPQARPGDTVRLGLWLEQDEGWHTYWKFNPDVGMPTDITWTTPEGVQLSPYAYPVPQRFELEGIISYGYDHQAFFFTELTLPSDHPPGPIPLGAAATWLTCEVNCIPGEGEVRTTLEVLPADAPAPEDGALAPIFDHFAAQHPSPTADLGDRVSFEASFTPTDGLRPDKTWRVTFSIQPAEGRTLGPHEPLGEDPWPTLIHHNDKDALWVDATRFEPQDDGSLVVQLEGEAYEVPSSRPIYIGGLWQLVIDGERVFTEFGIEVPWDPTVSDGSAESAATPAVPLAEGASPAVDDATCHAMTVGLASVESTSSIRDDGWMTLLLMLLGAFVGGLILNIMPCVLPVITLKLYGLVEQRTDSTSERVTEGLSYTAGILASFLALALAVVIAKVSFGQSVGWGVQFHSPLYVASLSAIVFAFGLSLFGVFEIPALGANQAAQASHKEGPAGYFLTGIFATLLATPCSAPFLGSAMGFAFSQSPPFIVLFFLTAGLGLAAPFLLIALVPALYRLLPQPGPWMETFKQVMGFTLVATALWLVTVLAEQITPESTIGFVLFLGVLGFASWIYGHFGGVAAGWSRQLLALAAALIALVIGGYFFVEFEPKERRLIEQDGKGLIPWHLLTEERMASVLARYREEQTDHLYEGRPLFFDFTAEWCLTCKVNEKTVIETDAVAKVFEDHDVVPLKGDWTNNDPNITSWLGCYQRAGVPFYVVLPADPNKPAIPLGEALTPGMIRDAIERATGS
ncbi:MAG: hypothetical protein EA397_10245 [Deltaproteobacteria bacterium]|nr:MAG: hypothetical protein EA397_10245 [Deltaproteobacteria bacterium]